MTKTLEELHKAWRKANADYGRALRDFDWSDLTCRDFDWSDLTCRDFDWSDLTCRDFDQVAKAQRAMDIAWENYDAAFKALLDAVAEAAQLKPCESATNPAPPLPLPR